jgi:hypothetical protein
MNCPRCGLSVRLVAPYMLVERCPRCLAHRRQIVEMYVTATFPPQPLSPPGRAKLPGPGSGRTAGADLSV